MRLRRIKRSQDDNFLSANANFVLFSPTQGVSFKKYNYIYNSIRNIPNKKTAGCCVSRNKTPAENVGQFY